MRVEAIRVPNDEQRTINILIGQKMTNGCRDAARRQLLKTTLISSSVEIGKVDVDLCLYCFRRHAHGHR
jgi:hypothetical protein